MSASASTAFRNLELTSEQADAMGLGGEDFNYAVTERALDADTGDGNDGDEAAIPPEVPAGFSAMLGVFIDTVIPPEGCCPHPQAVGARGAGGQIDERDRQGDWHHARRTLESARRLLRHISVLRALPAGFEEPSHVCGCAARESRPPPSPAGAGPRRGGRDRGWVRRGEYLVVEPAGGVSAMDLPGGTTKGRGYATSAEIFRRRSAFPQPRSPVSRSSTEAHIEHVEHQENLPLRIFVHSVRRCASHHHRDCEFLFVLKGQVAVHTSIGETLLRADDVFFIHGSELHLTRETAEPNLLVALQVDTGLAMRLDSDFPRRRFEFNRLARKFPNDPRIHAVRGILAETLWEMRLRRPAYRIQVESLVLRLLTVLVREIPSGLASAPRVEHEGDEALGQRLARIVAHLEAHSSEELSSAEVAAGEDVSVSYLARLFKERLGSTFSDYLNLLRARKSLPLLADEAATILDLALECGFPSVKSYNLVFKRIHGMTPSEWRRRQGGVKVAGIGESAYNRLDTGFAYHLLKKYLPANSVALSV